MRKKAMKLVQVSLLVIAAIYLGGCGPVPFPFYDDFSDPTTLTKYHIFDEKLDDNEQIVNGQLEIWVKENQDLWGKHIGGGPPAKRGAPLVLIDAPSGSYQAEALVTATNPDSPGGPQALNTQVGLFVFIDTYHWLFYGFTNIDFTDIDGNTNQFDGLMMTETVDGVSEKKWQIPLENDSMYLRLRKLETQGGQDSVRLWWRYPKSDIWNQVGTVYLQPMSVVGTEEVGMGVKTFDFGVVVGDGAWVGLGLFDDFRVDTY